MALAYSLERKDVKSCSRRRASKQYDRIRKVSRTVADLAGSDEIGPEHVSEAVQYRNLDRLG